ncbi:hypothetical protein QQF73_08665 [Marinobacter sp. M216]|uniref:Uncharacterized protein n=1 Tax=Marinobacter albus TaxID=3030833 RepID=A0ABT7HBE2_9GAMM|nr:hypothetical protein [Marinobacter sp. M216]MDK9557693.1 hypothetical protein [Marinobacter sp. M216]
MSADKQQIQRTGKNQVAVIVNDGVIPEAEKILPFRPQAKDQQRDSKYPQVVA